MKHSFDQRIKYRVSAQIVATGILLGLIYVVFSNGLESIYPYINGAVCGALMGALISYLELWRFRSGVRQFRFITLLVLRTSIYLLLIFTILFNVVVVSRMWQQHLSYPSVLRDAGFQSYLVHGNFPVAILYSMLFAFTIHFTRMMSRKMGQGVLASFVTGTFYQPVVQERIVMFLGLRNHGPVSATLSDLEFFRFLNAYFYDLTEPIVSHRGIIYEYVEDLIVITWSMKKGLEDSNCLRTFLAIQQKIQEKAGEYLEKYHIAPEAYASLHLGSVVRAEIGSVKTQIVFHGDVMNTASRLLGKCLELKRDLLVSENVVEKLCGSYSFHPEGSFPLKGKTQSVRAFSISEKGHRS